MSFHRRPRCHPRYDIFFFFPRPRRHSSNSLPLDILIAYAFDALNKSRANQPTDVRTQGHTDLRGLCHKEATSQPLESSGCNRGQGGWKKSTNLLFKTTLGRKKTFKSERMLLWDCCSRQQEELAEDWSKWSSRWNFQKVSPLPPRHCRGRRSRSFEFRQRHGAALRRSSTWIKGKKNCNVLTWSFLFKYNSASAKKKNDTVDSRSNGF